MYSKLKWEAGVHRVQRVPATEAAGRVHTSTATVAIMPEVDEVDVQLDMRDIDVKFARSVCGCVLGVGWGQGRGGGVDAVFFGGGGWLCVLLSRGRQGCACVGGAEPGCMLRVVYSACLSGGRPVTFAPACRITPKWGVRHKGLGRGAGRRGQMEAEGGGGGVRGLLCCMSRLTHSCILQSCPPAADELCPCLPPPSFSLTLHAGRRVQEVRM